MGYYHSVLINAMILVRESIAYYISNSKMEENKKEILSYADDCELFNSATDR